MIPSYTIEYLESLSEAERDALLLPAYAPVDHFPKVQVPEGRAEYFSRGMESNIEHEAAEQVLVLMARNVWVWQKSPTKTSGTQTRPEPLIESIYGN